MFDRLDLVRLCLVHCMGATAQSKTTMRNGTKGRLMAKMTATKRFISMFVFLSDSIYFILIAFLRNGKHGCKQLSGFNFSSLLFCNNKCPELQSNTQHKLICFFLFPVTLYKTTHNFFLSLSDIMLD